MLVSVFRLYKWGEGTKEGTGSGERGGRGKEKREKVKI